MNILALIGAVFAVTGTVFGILEAVIKEFVEVFLPLEDGADAELSCRIGNLGVFTASYDPSCLDPQVLVDSRVPTESFSAPTTEFKLLFPAQEEFINEVLPLNEDLINTFADAGGLDDTTRALFLGAYDAATPEFETCEQYLGQLSAGLLNLFALFDGVIAGVLIDQGLGALNEGLDDELAPGLAQILAAIRSDDVTQNPIGGIIFGTIGIAGPAIGADCFIDVQTTPLDANDISCVQQAIDDFAVNLPLNTAALLSSYKSLLLPGLTAFQSIGLGVTFEQTVPLLTPLSGSGNPCLRFGGAPNCENLVHLTAGFLRPIALQLVAIDGATFANLTLAAQGFGLIGAVAQVFPDLVFGAANDGALVAALAGVPETISPTNFYPATFAVPNYNGCRVQSLVGTLGGFIGVTPLASANTECTFLEFLNNLVALAGQADTPPPAFLTDLLGQLVVLFNTCAAFEPVPSRCAKFFPSLFLSGAYSLSLNLSAFSGDGELVFEEALGKCEDDEIDIEKISTAQKLLPVAIVSIGLGAVAGAIATVAQGSTGTIATIAALVLSLSGAVLNLAALLGVQSAPVYDLVGGEPEQYKPLYKAGITQIYGLIFIATGVIAALLFGVSLIPAVKNKLGGGGESKELKVIP